MGKIFRRLSSSASRRSRERSGSYNKVKLRRMRQQRSLLHRQLCIPAFAGRGHPNGLALVIWLRQTQLCHGSGTSFALSGALTRKTLLGSHQRLGACPEKTFNARAKGPLRGPWAMAVLPETQLQSPRAGLRRFRSRWPRGRGSRGQESTSGCGANSAGRKAALWPHTDAAGTPC